MAQFIQKFANRRDYEASEHQYPNVSLIEDEGLVYTMEQPEPDVLLNANKIKWNFIDDGVIDRTSVKYPSISVDDAQMLIRALNNPKDYNVNATVTIDDGGKIKYTDAECWFKVVSSSEIQAYFNIDKNETTICNIGLFSSTKSPAYNAATVSVGNAMYRNATWEINYTIDNAL